ncbi:hypothetical protein [Methylomicrobium album]|uniref:Uncharacterized protein n=1 Tax=Methylomicrobium album BG8 TaxID=686340 RepID=H8GIY4_METAL|nr:hypothetical protein [Methylomicrobium album]EIC31491.1 hypothetical protein Metal_3850 [Methylomicrobium album BG8]
MMRLTNKVIAASVGTMLLGSVSAVSEADTFDQSLGNFIGATDSYRITCQSSPEGAIGPTDHLNFKIIDTTPSDDGSTPLLLNIHVKKGNKRIGFVTHDETEVTPGTQREFEVAGGKGTYKITVDTLGTTDTSKTTKHMFSVETRCLNDNGEFTKPKVAKIKTKTLKNGKKANLSAVCGKNKLTGETGKLYVKFANTTADPARVVLNAQVLKDNWATNVTDGNGDDIYSDAGNLKGGNGDYTVLVNSTAYNPLQDNARDYTMDYRCENSANADTGTADIVPVQDQ